jgi:hypothetical protein
VIAPEKIFRFSVIFKILLVRNVAGRHPLFAMKTFIVLAALLATALSESTPTFPTSTVKPSVEHKFLDILNGPGPEARSNIPSTTTTQKTRTDIEQAALSDALLREQELKKQLAEAKNTVAINAAQIGAPSAAAVVPVIPVVTADTKLPEKVDGSTTVAPVVAAVPMAQNQSPFSSLSGLMSLLSPHVLTQQEAANQLTPQLDNNPAIHNFLQQQIQGSQQRPQSTQQFQNPQLTPINNGYGQNVYPNQGLQQQYPIQNPATFPQQGFQQPGQFASPYGANPSLNTNFIPNQNLLGNNLLG